MGTCWSKKKKKQHDVASAKLDQLKSLSFSQLPDFTMAGTKTHAKVVSVYDADTFRVVFEFRGVWCKKQLRLKGVDAPEIKPTKTTPDRELHIEAAKLARDVVSKWILGKIVLISLEKEDKYGRALGSVTLSNGHDLSDELLQKGLVLPYNGKTKTEWYRVDLTHCVASANHLLKI